MFEINQKVFSDLVYSVDMVRLSSFALSHEVEEFFNGFSNNPNVFFKEMNSISSYRYNFTFKDFIEYNGLNQDCSFWVGVKHNAKSNSPMIVDLVIQFNPNKCTYSYLLNLVLDRFFLSKFTDVKSLDFAIDIPVNIRSIFSVKSGHLGYKLFDNGGDDITHYYRKRNSHGHIKIYNKSRELGVKDFDLTRYEITLKPNLSLSDMLSYSVPSDLFIPIRFADSLQFDLKLDGTDLVLLLTCLEYPERINFLGRRKKQTIKDLLDKYLSPFAFDYSKINFFISSYFNTLSDRCHSILSYYAELRTSQGLNIKVF